MRPARTSPRLSAEQIAHARAIASIADIAERGGIVWDSKRSRPATGDYWALCPFHAEKTASFHVRDRGGEGSFFKCHGCDEKGDAISLASKLFRVGFREALAILGGDLSVEPSAELIEARERAQRAAEAEAKRQRAANHACAVAIWEASEPIAGTPATRYLREARGIDGDLGAADLRFHHAASLWPYEPAKAGRRPAMVAAIRNAAGEQIGAHLTFLRPDGLGKAELPHLKGSRMIAGEHVGGFIKLGRVRDVAVAGEGIETTLSASDACGLPGLAAVNSVNLRALVWPPLRRLVIAFDRDAGGVGELSAEVLAQRACVAGVTVELFGPPAGCKDWNDAARDRKRERAA